jgi:hypothetical protein
VKIDAQRSDRVRSLRRVAARYDAVFTTFMEASVVGRSLWPIAPNVTKPEARKTAR